MTGGGKAGEGKVIDVEVLLEEVTREAVADERRDFIRQAAIAIAAMPHTGVPVEAIWAVAAALWNAKPEDC